MENIPELNQRVKDARLFLKLNQRAVCKTLDINPSYYSGVESGKRKVTSRIIEGYTKFFSVSTDWLYTGNGEMMLTKSTQQSTLNDVPTLYPLQSERQVSDTKSQFDFRYRFGDLIKDNYPEFAALESNLFTLFSMKQLLDDLEESKIGKAIYFGIGSFRKPFTVKNFKEYKAIGFQSLNEAYPYNKIIIEFAKACKIFVGELRKIKDEINLDFDFEDFFNEVKEDTDGEEI